MCIRATKRQFRIKQNEHLKEKNKSGIGYHENPSKRNDFTSLGSLLLKVFLHVAKTRSIYLTTSYAAGKPHNFNNKII